MNAIVSITHALEPIAHTVAPKFTVEVDYPTAQITVDMPNNTLVYSVDFDTENQGRYDSDSLDLCVTIEDNCTVTACDDEGDVVYETMIKTPDWIHSDAVVAIEKALTACEY